MKDAAARFWSKVDRRGPDECWEWKGSTTEGGYGHCRFEGRVRLAHRIAWVLERGRILKRCLCHTCDNRLCVNPAHLFEGSYRDNVQDALSKGRHPLGVENGRAKLDVAKVLKIRALAGVQTQRAIAASLGVSKATIQQIIERRTWAHVK